MTSSLSDSTGDVRRPVAGSSPLLVLASMSTLQVGVAFSRDLFASLGVAGTTMLRLAFAALVLLVVTRPRLRDKTPRQLAVVAALGIVSGAQSLLFAAAIARIPLALASTIDFLGPFGVALARSRRALDAVWAVIATSGVVMITWVGIGGATGGLDPAGLGFAAGAAMSWAGYIVLTSKVGVAFKGFQGLAISMTVAALAVAPFGVREAWRGLVGSRAPLLLLLATAGVAMMVPAIPYLLEMEALRRLSEHAFSILMSLEPSIAVLVGLVVLGQALNPAQLAGIGCVVAASVAATLADRGRDGSPAVGGTSRSRQGG